MTTSAGTSDNNGDVDIAAPSRWPRTVGRFRYHRATRGPQPMLAGIAPEQFWRYFTIKQPPSIPAVIHPTPEAEPAEEAPMSIPHPRPQRRPAPRSGFTLIEMLVVISIIGILAGLLMPAIVGALDQAKMTQCGNNQRQILLCMQIYRNQSEGESALRMTNGTGGTALLTDPAAADAAVGRATTLASLEWMAYINGGIGSKIFTCPSFKNGKLSNPGADATFQLGAGVSKWANEDKEKMGFAYDWSAPSSAEAMRVVLADRGRDGSISHKNKVVVAFADCHTSMILQTPKAVGAGTATENFAGGITTGVFSNSESSDTAVDNIYDTEGDGNNMYLAGRGSATKCWVK